MKAYLRAVWALARRDALLERRSLETTVATVSFALLVVVMFYFAFDVRPGEGERFFPGALWIALLFSGSVGMARSARLDEVDGRGEGAALAPVDRSALFFGRFIFHLGLVGLMELIAVPLFIAAFSPGRIEDPALFIAGLALGTWGLVALGTLLAGVAGGEGGSGLLLPVVLFPLLVPVALGGTAIVQAATTGDAAAAGAWLRVLFVFDALFTAVPALFYEYILEV